MEYSRYIKDQFRKYSPIYDAASLVLHPYRKKIVDLSEATKDSKILDLCTGTGAQAIAFSKIGCDVTAMDLSEDMLKIAQKKTNRIKFILADASKLPFKNKSFDIVTISFGLHEMPFEIAKQAVVEALRVSKKTIIIADFALPEKGILKRLGYIFIKSFESKYYPEFISKGFSELVPKDTIMKETKILGGFGKIIIIKKN
jgi:ubiquinone/menaquinone biosynthesis C-methylase UbiE